MRKHATATLVLVFLTTALIGVIGPPGTAAAQEPTTTARYEELSRSAARASEDVLTARQVLDDKRVALDEATGAADRSRLLADEAAEALTRATDAADAAKAVETGLRAEIDHIVEISFKGLRLNGLAAIFSSDSPEEFLDAAMIMDVYAERHGDLVTAAATASDDAALARSEADTAQHRAAEASLAADETRDTARRLTDEAAEAARGAERRQERLDGEVAEVRRALDLLATADRTLLAGTGPAVDVPAADGAGGDAVRFALAQLGKPYVWGAVGPDTYDCSGLVMAAFRSAGVLVPRTTYTQALIGTPVPRDQVRAGDLVLYHDSLSHVAMAIDGTMAVHASTAGEPVKVSPINAIGPIATIRRVSG
ncbi:C40 family peptidase [Umezawaea endophytica]|uniref:C40 family peptidase n=1 Tax=Umezawaea endophytica TaxID=1654476 RepID=A0A9X3A2T5_9PSEU|nr:C40 family peptidase [Umezawaea endophytica]MCS7479443.1 C40 family peptidase [Umezawaea endophytica]